MIAKHLHFAPDEAEGMVTPVLDEILFMETRLFRMFREQCQLTPAQANELFERQGIWHFIEECYDYLHLESDEAALSDIFCKLAAQGITP